MNKFYVYEHWRLDRDECFYVGMGSGRRAYDMGHRGPLHKGLRLKLEAEGSGIEVRLVKTGLTRHEAYILEVERVTFWRAFGVDLVNISRGGAGGHGRKLTEEEKAHLSRKHTGKKLSPEHIAKVAEKRRGHKWTDEQRARLSEQRKGRKMSPMSDETKAKISAAKKNPSAETLEKLSKAAKGRIPSAEARAKMSAAAMGKPKPKSEAHKQKLREANLGKKHSDETRAKLSEIASAQWAYRNGGVS